MPSSLLLPVPPIDTEQKSTLGKFYGGGYLDIYNIKQSVEDGATLPILYEDGIPELYVEKGAVGKAVRVLLRKRDRRKESQAETGSNQLEKNT